MATLVLTAVGGVIGGPVGAAIGATVGRSIDGSLFGPGRREGPRLTELKVQTSSYGTQIPKLFGTIRVAGCVIWATDLIETRTSEGGGKGRPGSVQYSYAASFAVALSSREIVGVRRIWADGNLLRGAAGDLKLPTGFRLHRGGEDQAVDPLIASAQGVARTPAWRGTAYAVFENMQLGDFGNRIPSLTFEVMADELPVPSQAVAEAIGGGTIRGEDPVSPVASGFSAHGGSVRAVLESLAEAGGAWFASQDERIEMRSGAGAAAVRTVVDHGVGGAGRQRSIATADAAPKTLSVAHYDAARDYQAGFQRAVRPGAGARELNVTLPMVLAADEAKGVAVAMLARLDSVRQRRRVTMGWEAIDIAPGDRIRIGDEAGMWRVTRTTVEGAMRVTLELVPVTAVAASAAASPGSVVVAPDLAHGPSVVAAAELPPIDGAPPGGPRVTVVAAGTMPGWRGAALSLSTDGGARWQSVGTTRAPVAIGTVIGPPPVAAAVLEDRRGAIVVELANDAMMLTAADAVERDRGANLALVGHELVQFGHAERIGERRWRLSLLWRGRFGTEHAIDGHVAGERFAMLPPEGVVTIDLPTSAIGGEVLIAASGIGDGDTMAMARVAIDGASVRPPCPVHLRSEGGMSRWTRRSRDGWRWSDGVDVPLVEERERYAVSTETGETIVGETAVTVDMPVLAVAQLGTLARSLAARNEGRDDV